jgi:hypothetical protein
MSADSIEATRVAELSLYGCYPETRIGKNFY